jgi:hypothetical protein
MFSAILMSTNGAKLLIPKWYFALAQGIIGCLTESTAEGKENPGGELLGLASQDVAARWKLYAQLAKDWRLS